MPVPEVLDATRVVAAPAALDAHPGMARIASDEALWLGPGPLPTIDDPHAMVDRTPGLAGVRMTPDELEAWMEREADWHPAGPFCQGLVAGLPVKIYPTDDVSLVITRASLRWELEKRL